MRHEMHPIEPEELMAYLDGELPPQRASIASDHLSHCLDCQLAAAEMQDVSRRLLDWQIEEPAPRVSAKATLLTITDMPNAEADCLRHSEQ